MAAIEATIHLDPTQDKFYENILFLDHVLAVFVDRILLIVDRHLAKTPLLKPERGYNPNAGN